MVTELPPSGELARHRLAEDAYQSDRVDAASWVALVVWGTLVLVVTNTGLHERYDGWDGWRVFFVGTGVVVLLATAFRLLTPEYRWKWWRSLVWGVILLFLGLGALYVAGWFALIAFAAVSLGGALD